MKIELDSDVIRQAVAESVMLSLGPEQREKIIADAVTELLSSGEKDHYGRQQPAPVFRIFKSAVEHQAAEIARSQLAVGAPMGDKLAEVVRDALQALLVDDADRRDKLASAIGEEIAQVLVREAWK